MPFLPRKPVKVLRMADYFRPPQGSNTLSMMSASQETTADEKTNQSNMMSQIDMQTKELKMKEELEARLEQDILDNVDVNFIFNKGTGLASGLIDCDRIYSVMNKLKELAYKQLQSGSDKINYSEIVNYLRDTEGFFADEIILKDDRKKAYIGEADLTKLNSDEDTLKTSSVQKIADEPALVGLENDEDEKKRRWNMTLAFLRNNPKLLLQMIPNSNEHEIDMMAKQIPVGKPRPRKSTKMTSEKQNLNSARDADIPRAPVKNRYLAISSGSGSHLGKNRPSQKPISYLAAAARKPIKVRPNALRNRIYNSHKQT